MTLEEIIEAYPDENLLYPTGFEDCIVGIIESEMILVLDKNKIIQKLIKEDKMTDIDAIEHYHYNIEGSRGEGYPIYITTKFE
jgi:hypothetical protein